MRFEPILASLLLIVATPSLASAQKPAAKVDGAPVRRALLIGINAYASKDVPRLRGCVNDVEAMRALLTTRFGFAPENVRMLTDAQATRAGILAAIGKLVDEARPQDEVFLHYAGHGSQVPDTDGDEPDGKDETLVPQDGRTEGVPDITDDELNALLARLRSTSAVIVLDCCHSGTGTRSVAVQARRLDEDTRADLYKKPAATRAIVPLPSERYVLMTGAADRESALDGPIEGDYHGAFSFALVRTLSAAPADAAPRALFLGVEGEMRRLGDQWMIASMPEPQLEAPEKLLDAPLLPRGTAESPSTAPAARVAWSDVTVDAGSHRASLDARSLGAVAGSLWDVYPPGETAFDVGGSAAVAEVVSVESDRAYLEVRAGDAAIGNGSRAILSSPPPAGDEIPVHLSGLGSEALAALAAEVRASLPGFQSVGSDAFALLHVEMGKDGFRVLGSDGVALVATVSLAPIEAPAAKLVAAIERCLDAAELMTLDNPSSGLQLEIRVGAPSTREATRVGTRGFKVVADNGAPVFRYRKGTRGAANSLQLSVQASADCYLTIVDVDAEGSMNLLFPNRSTKEGFLPEGRIAGGAWHQIPDSLEDGNRAGFYWDAREPAGMDTIRVFASTDPAFAEDLRGALRDLEAEAAQLSGRGLGRAIHAARHARLSTLRRSIASRGFKVVEGGAAPSAPGSAAPTEPAPAKPAAAKPAPAKPATAEPASAASTPANEPSDSDWTAASTTVRIEP